MSTSVHSTDEIEESKETSRLKTFLSKKLFPLLFKQFMTIGILIALFVGFVFPQLGVWVGSFEGSTYICIIMIFLHSGLKLKTAAIKDAIKEYKGFIWGLISIVLITTLIGTKLTQQLPFCESVANNEHDDGNKTLSTCEDSIVGPREFLIGFEFYYISPCAVAAGIVMVSLPVLAITVAAVTSMMDIS